MNFEQHFSHAGLYQIGEVAKFCGVNRQTILFYERKGLLSHSVQNQSSGYRYYSATDVINLLFILRVRDAGMSIKEIDDFLKNGSAATDRVIESMEKKLAALLTGLAEMRAMSVKKGDYTVSWRSLPAMRCLVQEYCCSSIGEAMANVYAALEKAMIAGVKVYDFFAEYPDAYETELNLKHFTLRTCVQVRADAGMQGCVDYPPVSGISVCHRGDYALIGAAYDALWTFARGNRLSPVGPVREQYLDSRREYEKDADRYVTLLILPVEDRRSEKAPVTADAFSMNERKKPSPLSNE